MSRGGPSIDCTRPGNFVGLRDAGPNRKPIAAQNVSSIPGIWRLSGNVVKGMRLGAAYSWSDPTGVIHMPSAWVPWSRYVTKMSLESKCQSLGDFEAYKVAILLME